MWSALEEYVWALADAMKTEYRLRTMVDGAQLASERLW